MTSSSLALPARRRALSFIRDAIVERYVPVATMVLALDRDLVCRGRGDELDTGPRRL